MSLASKSGRRLAGLSANDVRKLPAAIAEFFYHMLYDDKGVAAPQAPVGHLVPRNNFLCLAQFAAHHRTGPVDLVAGPLQPGIDASTVDSLSARPPPASTAAPFARYRLQNQTTWFGLRAPPQPSRLDTGHAVDAVPRLLQAHPRG